MKRWVALILLLLIGGATVNVAVAWTIATLMPRSLVFGLTVPSDPRISIWWNRSAPEIYRLPTQRKDATFLWSGLGLEGFGAVVKTSDTTITGHRQLIGWPSKSMVIEMWMAARPQSLHVEVTGIRVTNDRGRYPRALPLQVIWSPFASNTAFYAAILWVVFFVPGILKRTRRRRHGLCPACAYPVGTSNVCTECGNPLGKGR